jgi:hypothetical protein
MTFEDGRKGVVEGDLRIIELPIYPARGELREAAE